MWPNVEKSTTSFSIIAVNIRNYLFYFYVFTIHTLRILIFFHQLHQSKESSWSFFTNFLWNMILLLIRSLVLPNILPFKAKTILLLYCCDVFSGYFLFAHSGPSGHYRWKRNCSLMLTHFLLVLFDDGTSIYIIACWLHSDIFQNSTSLWLFSWLLGNFYENSGYSFEMRNTNSIWYSSSNNI